MKATKKTLPKKTNYEIWGIPCRGDQSVSQCILKSLVFKEPVEFLYFTDSGRLDFLVFIIIIIIASKFAFFAILTSSGIISLILPRRVDSHRLAY